MQISRHWRMQPQRYRLVGTRYSDGSVSIQPKIKYAQVEEQEPIATDERIEVQNWPTHVDLKTQR